MSPDLNKDSVRTTGVIYLEEKLKSLTILHNKMQLYVVVITSIGGKSHSLLWSGPISLWSNLCRFMCLFLNALDLCHPVDGVSLRSTCFFFFFFWIKTIHISIHWGLWESSSQQLGTGLRALLMWFWQSVGVGGWHWCQTFCSSSTQTLLI